MGNIRVALAGAVLAIGLSFGAAQAAPVGAANGAIAHQGGSLVTKTHGVHRICRLGRYGWHRHYHGRRIACGRVVPRCVTWRHTCAKRWGWGTYAYRRCMRLHRCG